MERFIKIFIPIMGFFLIIGIVAATCLPNLYNDTVQNPTPNKFYQNNGISFNYSSNWDIIPTVANEALITSVGTKDYNTMVYFIKTPIPQSQFNTLYKSYQAYYQNKSSLSGFKIIFESKISKKMFNLMENDVGYLIIYQHKQNGNTINNMDYWQEKDNNYYLIFCNTTDTLDNQKQNFDLILNTFKIQ